MSRQLHRQAGGIDNREDPLEDLELALGLLTDVQQKRPPKEWAVDMNRAIDQLRAAELMNKVDLKLDAEGTTLMILTDAAHEKSVQEALTGCNDKVLSVIARPSGAPDVSEFTNSTGSKVQQTLFDTDE